jgi:transposase
VSVECRERAPAYPEEFRREAVELLRAGRTPSELSESLGVSEQTLRNWRRQDQIDRHERDDGLTSDEREEPALRRENLRLRQERDLLKRAAAFFATANETRR